MRKLTLKEAIDKGKLPEFIKQNQELIGNKKQLDQAINSMLSKSKSTRQTSTEDSSES